MTGAADTRTVHRPVLLRETITGLELASGLTVVDGTVGAAGHSVEILRRIRPGGRLLGCDRDPAMLARAREVLSRQSPEPQTDGEPAPSDYELVHAPYDELPAVLATRNIPAVDRILLDLGLSSDQLADPDRGFGWQTEGELDMRFDPTSGEPVRDWLARASLAEITTALTEFADEPEAAAIAAAVLQTRKSRPLTTVTQLRELVECVYRERGAATGKTHPATRTFQALRIVANAELVHLQDFLTNVSAQSLLPGGRLVVISFHSTEDRIVKRALADRALWRVVTKKPITAGSVERQQNPRSRSAKLRIAIRAPR